MTDKLKKLREITDAAPMYPYKKWPINFIQYPEVNEMLDFALDIRTVVPILLDIIAVQSEAIDKMAQGCSNLLTLEQHCVEEAFKLECRDAQAKATAMLDKLEIG